MKPQLIEKLQSLSRNRGDGKGVFLNFISNSYRMRQYISCLISDRKNNQAIDIIISQHIISLVSIWETLFRDIFIYVVKKNPNCIEKLKIQKPKLKRNLNSIPIELAEEFVAYLFNFQNQDSIEEALAVLLGNTNGLKQLVQQRTLIIIRHKGIASFEMDKQFPTWHNDIDFLLAERHKIIHDANHRCSVTRKEIAALETELFFYQQLLGILFSTKHKLPWIKINIDKVVFEVTSEIDERKRGVLLTINDLLADDYETVE
jgi:hypothetical protein